VLPNVRFPNLSVKVIAWIAAFAILATPLHAHPGRTLEPADLWRAWNPDPWVLLGLGGAAWLYGRGVGRLWRRAGRGRGVSVGQYRSFAAGLLLVAIASLSPLHALGGALFSAHMLQHEILILLAAPLLALGAPIVAFAWALPLRIARGIRVAARTPPIKPLWNGVSHPAGAWLIHGLALWIWHEPRLYEATLASEGVHAAQHISFFGTAVLFWWAVLRLRHRRVGYGFGVLMVFTTMLHSNALGALLTFAPRAWYPAYVETAPRWGFTPLEDQQLGGLLMWIPGGMVYLAVALALLVGWLRLTDRSSVTGSAAVRRDRGVAQRRV
jgi:putative membrane protein